MPQISAIICTYNRADYLQRALQSLTRQNLALDNFEVIVVDNASTDNTAEMTQQFRSCLPHLNYIHETRLGLSIARNSGADAARTPYLAYLDDDARPESSWLEAILYTFEQRDPTPAIVGGRVWLDWEGELPTWLPREYWPLYTYVDHGEETRLLREKEYLVGANIAFHKKVLLEHGGFDANLGRRGRMLLSGEETALVKLFKSKNLPIYYAPQATVWHVVDASRRNRRWFLKRLFWDGASQPLLDFGETKSRSFYRQQAYYDFRRVVYFAWHWVNAKFKGETQKSREHGLAMIQKMGRFWTDFLLAQGRSL
jgi:glycosyltransferase involved in cell wall biosynthesis